MPGDELSAERAVLTRAELEAVMPLARGVADSVVEALDAAMRRFAIDTPPRMAAFTAQLAHESGQLRRWTENLNYGWARLRQVFPKYFTSDVEAQAFDRQPERIANRVYADRLGNGPEASGDGWRYRGRGPIQLTGRDNYRTCGSAIGVDLVGDPDLLAAPGPGCLAAAWFWARKGLNALADAGDFVAITRRINGGLTGLAERQEFWTRAKDVFGVAAVVEVGATAGAPVSRARPPVDARRGTRRRPRRARAGGGAAARSRRAGTKRASKARSSTASGRRRAPGKAPRPTTAAKQAPGDKRRRAASRRSRRRRAS
jgi:putative chitinase